MLNGWWCSSLSSRARAIRTVLDRARASVAVLCKLDIINRYSESARLYGISLFDVITRGSQYRVEAVMMRVLKPLGYCAPSANKLQVAQQASIEVIPLVLEPISQFYVDPVLVLDFQSLYPSMILAYNLCYSTCLGETLFTVCLSVSVYLITLFLLGRFTHVGDSRGATTGKIGFSNYPTSKTVSGLNSCDVGKDETELPSVTPLGTTFCHPSTREGVLPIMLTHSLNKTLNCLFPHTQNSELYLCSH